MAPAQTEPDPTAPAETDLRAMLLRTMDAVLAPWVAQLGLRLDAIGPDTVTLVMPVTPALVHGGGVACGQALMAAADTAMVLAVCRLLGAFRPMTTVQLATSFLRPVPGDAGALNVTARILKPGRNLVFGEVLLATADGRLAAHATTTYALL